MFSSKWFVVLTISVVILPMADSRRFDEFTKLLKDIIENEQVSSVLWARTCWPNMIAFNLAKLISIPIQIIQTNAPINLPTSENMNKQWFFADMNCDSTSKYLADTDEKYFAHPFRWVIADATHESIQNLTFLPSSDIILANRDASLKRYVLKQGNFNFFFFKTVRFSSISKK